MQPSSQTNIGATTKIPRPCPPNPAVKPRRNGVPPAQNRTPPIKPANTSTPTSAVVVIPRTSRKSMQTTMVVEQPQIQPPSISNSKLARSCTQCEPTKLLENSASLMYHKKYEHATVVFCPVPNCSYGNRPYKNWNSLRGSHIKTKHVRIWEQLKNAPAYYKSQPYYEKLHKVDRKHLSMTHNARSIFSAVTQFDYFNF